MMLLMTLVETWKVSILVVALCFLSFTLMFIHPEYNMTSSFCQLLSVCCSVFTSFSHMISGQLEKQNLWLLCRCIIFQAAAVSVVFHAVCKQKCSWHPAAESAVSRWVMVEDGFCGKLYKLWSFFNVVKIPCFHMHPGNPGNIRLISRTGQHECDRNTLKKKMWQMQKGKSCKIL